MEIVLTPQECDNFDIFDYETNQLKSTENAPLVPKEDWELWEEQK